jgi:nucleotide-binding universal stress UspA family protein
MAEQDEGRRIVVGADGSDASIAAVRWAVGQARLTGAAVEVVTGWEVPATIFLTPTYRDEDYQRDARRVLDHTVTEALAELPSQDVVVRMELVQTRPGRALHAAAENADLLVIGSHGRGEMPGMHLGSVASYCVHHAPCPVVVVRGRWSGR